MTNSALRIATLIFIGVVIFLSAACSTFLSSNSQSDTPDQQITNEIEDIEKKIEEEPTNGDLYFEKGKLLNELAQQKTDPAGRTPLYREMYKALKQAERELEESGSASRMQKIEELLNVAWSNEHNQGVKHSQSDSTIDKEDLDKAISFFNNATIILPDTAVSYQLKARTQYRNHDKEGAIQTLEKAREIIQNVPVELMEQLAFLYLDTDQPEEAADIYRRAESISEGKLNLLHGLINAYIEAEEHSKALQVLDILTENEPDNIIYTKTKGTQLYLLGARKIDSLQVTGIDKQRKEKLFSAGDSLWNEAVVQFQQAFENNEQDEEWKQELAEFYQTMSAKYQQSLPHISETSKETARQKIDDYLGASIPLYVSLVEQYPENKRFWRNLYTAYSYLEMDEKAAHAKSNLTEF